MANHKWSDDLKEIVLSFETSEDLERFAELYGIRNDPFIIQRLVELKWKELDIELRLPSVSTNPGIENTPAEVPRIQLGGRDESPLITAETSFNNNIPFEIKNKSEKQFLKSGAKETTFDVKFNTDNYGNKKLNQLHSELHEAFEAALKEAKHGYVQGDLAKVVLHHRDLDPIVVPLQPVDDVDADKVLERLENTLNSHEDLVLDNSFSLNIGCIQVPKGSGRSCLKIYDLGAGANNSIRRKKGMIEIRNDDRLCLPRAVIVSWCFRHRVSNVEWNKLTQNETGSIEELVLKLQKVPLSFYNSVRQSKTHRTQERFATFICEKAGVPTNKAGTLMDLPKFEEVLNVNIQVIGSRAGNNFIRVSNNRSRRHIYVYLDQKEMHFHSITRIGSMFSESYFCEMCLKPYSERGRHQCSTTCIVCKRNPCRATETQTSCKKCHMTCRSASCLLALTERKKIKKNGQEKELPSECDKFWKCTRCKKVLSRKHRDPQQHVCGEYVCESCKRVVLEGHLCYLRAYKSTFRMPKFIFYDAECTQDTTLQCSDGYLPRNELNCEFCIEKGTTCHKCSQCQNCRQIWCGKNTHLPNLIVAHKACSKCMSKQLTETSKCGYCGSRCKNCNTWDEKKQKFVKQPCFETCGFRETIFHGLDSATKFCHWVFTEEHSHSTLVAHNAKGYDAYFLLEYLIDHSILPSKSIFNGSKIMYLDVARSLNIRMVDSLNFLPMRLSALPKAFGFSELKKGHFPHFFNLQEHQEYVGPFPVTSFYGCDSMTTEERDEFLKWHAERMSNNDIFDFKKEILEYCRSDVDILRQACLQFRGLMIDITGEIEETKDPHTGQQTQDIVRAVDPFQSVTIASVCQKVFRQKFLKENWRVKLEKDKNESDWKRSYFKNDQLFIDVEGKWVSESQIFQQTGYNVGQKEFVSSQLAMIQSEGYNQRDQFSMVSIQWLEWLMYDSKRKGHPVNIQHALNGGPDSNYKLDGYCNNTAYEFLGCLWHGCRECYKSSRDSTILPRTKQSIEELYALTIRKKTSYKRRG